MADLDAILGIEEEEGDLEPDAAPKEKGSVGAIYFLYITRKT